MVRYTLLAARNRDGVMIGFERWWERLGYGKEKEKENRLHNGMVDCHKRWMGLKMRGV